MIGSFFTGFIEDGVAIMEPLRIVAHYVRTWWCVDLVIPHDLNRIYKQWESKSHLNPNIFPLLNLKEMKINSNPCVLKFSCAAIYH